MAWLRIAWPLCLYRSQSRPISQSEGLIKLLLYDMIYIFVFLDRQ